jgi:cysteine desulfurase/selenocysteine lyase
VVQQRYTPDNAGWKAGRIPTSSFFGPDMDLSPTASRFDNSISWVAAIGNEAALGPFEEFGPDAIFTRNRVLAGRLRAALADAGSHPLDLPEASRSTIVSVPLGDRDPAQLLAGLRRHGVVAAARDGNLRLSVHLYNHEDDIEQLVGALAAV